MGTGIGGNGNWWKQKLVVMEIDGNRKGTLLVETCIAPLTASIIYQDGKTHSGILERCGAITLEAQLYYSSRQEWSMDFN